MSNDELDTVAPDRLVPTARSVAALLGAGDGRPFTGERFADPPQYYDPQLVRVVESAQRTVTIETVTVRLPASDEPAHARTLPDAPWRSATSDAETLTAATYARAVRCYAKSADAPTRSTVHRYG
jgi:hypothetical protein